MLLAILTCLSIPALISKAESAASQQLERFYQEEEKVDDKFNDLNYSVFESLPFPEGIKQIKLSNEDSLRHGRELFVTYSNSHPFDEIFLVYDQFLSLNGWGLITADHDENSYFYNKGTACVDIRYGQDVSEYQIHIYHDFFNQSFSPEIPFPLNKNLITLMEFGETYFIECPEPLLP